MRTRKAMWNIVSSMIYQIVSIVCGLIVPRLILRTFGSTYNGVAESAMQFLSMVTVLNVGIAGATRVAFYQTLANGDELGTSRIYKSNKQYMHKVAGVIVGYAVVLMAIYPYVSHNDLAHWECSLLIGIVSIRTFGEYFFGISNRTLLDADQAGYVYSCTNIITNIANAVLTFLLIRLGANIFIVKLGSSVVFLLSPAIMNLYVKKKYHLISDCEPDHSAIRNRGAAAFHSIANIVHDRTDLLILTVFMDAKMISVYTVYYMIVGKVKSLSGVFTFGLEGAFGNMWVKEETEAINRSFRIFEYVMFMFTAVLFSCVGILILPFIRLYVSGVNDINYIHVDLAVLITITESLHCIRQPYLTLVQAVGRYEETKWGAAMEAGVNLVLSIVLVNVIGIDGVILGTLAANLIRTGQYMVYVSRHIIHRGLSEIMRRALWTCACVCIIVLVSAWARRFLVFPAGWIGCIEKAGATFFAACVVALGMSLLFYRKDLLELVGKGKQMLRTIRH